MALWVALIVCLAGLIVYALSNNGKVQAVAIHAFWVGLLVFLLHWGGTALPKP